MRVLLLQLTALAALLSPATARSVTFRNDISRLDTDGNVIDCHSGNILAVNGVFYMYGEHYGNSTGFGPSPPVFAPRIVVYTSSDSMTSWTYRGFVLADWPSKPNGTFFTPWAVYNAKTSTFVLWFNAYLQGCCTGNWGVATSTNGINFTVVSLNQGGKYAVVDGNGLFVDDDGAAYNVYTSEAEDHKVSIERLSDNYTAVAVPNANGGLFPDRYVEGAVLFKQLGTYYVGYGSCCCFCRAGSGWIVYSSQSISGPWKRQPYDLNCASTDPAKICGGYGDRSGDALTVNAQGIGLSVIPLVGGGTAYLWSGERWLSAPNNNPACPDECRAESGECAESVGYIKGDGFMYWVPLAFTPDGSVAPFAPFVDSFTLDVAEVF